MHCSLHLRFLRTGTSLFGTLFWFKIVFDIEKLVFFFYIHYTLGGRTAMGFFEKARKNAWVMNEIKHTIEESEAERRMDPPDVFLLDNRLTYIFNSKCFGVFTNLFHRLIGFYLASPDTAQVHIRT